jgi:hypothetical protein
MKLPDNRRRETIILTPETDVTGHKKIGDDITEILELVPAAPKLGTAGVTNCQ